MPVVPVADVFLIFDGVPASGSGHTKQDCFSGRNSTIAHMFRVCPRLLSHFGVFGGKYFFKPTAHYEEAVRPTW